MQSTASLLSMNQATYGFISLDATSKQWLTSMFAGSLVDNVFTTIVPPSSSALRAPSGGIEDS